MVDAVVYAAALDRSDEGLICDRHLEVSNTLSSSRWLMLERAGVSLRELAFAGACAYINGLEFMQARVHASRLGE
jgi:hypothetical protein